MHRVSAVRRSCHFGLTVAALAASILTACGTPTGPRPLREAPAPSGPNAALRAPLPKASLDSVEATTTQAGTAAPASQPTQPWY